MTAPREGTVEQLRNPGYEVFVLALSVLSIVNLVLLLPFSPLSDVQQRVVLAVDSCLSLVFLGDFAYRLATAESKRGYFLRGGGWLDLIGSLPTLRIARIFRILRVGRLLREYGAGTLVRWLIRERAQSALYVVGFLVVVVIETAAVAVLPVEARSPDANIADASDALWWGIVTITTVGYGDQFPVTNAGRILGTLLLVTGVGLFGTFTGFLANAFLAPSREERPALGPPGDPRALVGAIRSELAGMERRSAELRARLDELDAALDDGASGR